MTRISHALVPALLALLCTTPQAQSNVGGITKASSRTATHSKPEQSDLDLHSLLLPIPSTAQHREKGYFVWDGSIIRGVDGKYHMYYSRWPTKDTFNAWLTHSEVVHAISKSPFGPFVFHDVALAPRGASYWDGSTTHNPKVTKFGKKYYLYYMGNVGTNLLSDGHGTTNMAQRYAQRIGVAVADNPNGPWQRFDKPLIDVSSDEDAPDSGMANNPTVIQGPEGKYLMIYKAAGKPGSGKPVVHLLATADSPLGPFKKELVDLFPIAGISFPFEDPCLWYDTHRKKYFTILKDMKGYSVGTGKSTLVLFESKDARHWSLATHPIVSDLKLTWVDGHVQPVRRMERPQLEFDAHGSAIALTTAILDTKGDSWIAIIPLRKDNVR